MEAIKAPKAKIKPTWNINHPINFLLKDHDVNCLEWIDIFTKAYLQAQEIVREHYRYARELNIPTKGVGRGRSISALWWNNGKCKFLTPASNFIGGYREDIEKEDDIVRDELGSSYAFCSHFSGTPHWDYFSDVSKSVENILKKLISLKYETQHDKESVDEFRKELQRNIARKGLMINHKGTSLWVPFMREDSQSFLDDRSWMEATSAIIGNVTSSGARYLRSSSPPSGPVFSWEVSSDRLLVKSNLRDQIEKIKNFSCLTSINYLSTLCNPLDPPTAVQGNSKFHRSPPNVLSCGRFSTMSNSRMSEVYVKLISPTVFLAMFMLKKGIDVEKTFKTMRTRTKFSDIDTVNNASKMILFDRENENAGRIQDVVLSTAEIGLEWAEGRNLDMDSCYDSLSSMRNAILKMSTYVPINISLITQN